MRTNNRTNLSASLKIGAAAVVIPMLLMTPAFAGSALQSVSLQYKLTAGKTYTYSQVMKMSMANGPGGSMNGSSDLIYKIDKATANGFTTTMTMKNLKMTGAGANQAGQLEGTKVTMSYDKFGNSTSSAQMSKGSPAAFGNSFGAAVGFNGILFSKTPVAVGGSWSTTLDIKKALAAQNNPMMSMMKLKSGSSIPVKYTLKSITTKGSMRIATIVSTMKGNIRMEMDMSSMGGGAQGGQTPQKMEMAMAMDGKMNYTINLADGMMQTGTANIDMNISVMGQNIKQKVTTESKLK